MEKTTLQEKNNVLKDEVERQKEKAKENEKDKEGGEVSELKKEIEQLTVTNSVYMEKIKELVDTMNKMDENHKKIVASLKK